MPAAGGDGGYSAPSLGCSGTLVVQNATGAIMTAMARTTGTVYPGCVAKARLAGYDLVRLDRDEDDLDAPRPSAPARHSGADSQLVQAPGQPAPG
jgi:hypothetical protein